MTGLEAALAGAAIKEAFGPTKALIAKFGRPQYERLIVELCRCFQPHIDASSERCKYVKNVLYRDNSVELKSQYVNVSFDYGSASVSDVDLSSTIKEGGRLLVSGTAGAGKTMFMKWLTLNLIEDLPQHQRIPLFLEFRYLNDKALSNGLLDFILQSTSKADGRVTLDRFEMGLKLGQFILVLDAVDEVRPELRDQIISEIRSLIQNYPLCPILLSTRPDEELESIQEINVFRTKSMQKDQIIQVIQKLEFDNAVKSRLIEKLESGLFEQHEEFLANPLLATIMLLNFDHSADIPTQLTSFYRQAFEALYQRHDAAKGAYRRGHYAGLPLDQYEKVFSAFCFDSYLDSKVQFSDSELLDYFGAASQYYNIEAKSTDLVHDAMKSVCVIQREGLDNVFAHRSFQEYFTALFLSRYREDDFVDQVEGTIFGWVNNNVLRMLLEIAPEPVEQDFVEPLIRKVIEPIKRVKPNTLSGATKIFKAFYSSLEIEVDGGAVRGFSSSDKAMWPRASLVGTAYTPEVMLTRAIFNSGSVFDNLGNFVETLDSNIFDKDQIMQRVEHVSHLENGIEITASDLPWLMNSNLPKMLDAVRLNFMNFHTELKDRIEKRANAMNRLRTRHPTRNAIRRRQAV